MKTYEVTLFVEKAARYNDKHVLMVSANDVPDATAQVYEWVKCAHLITCMTVRRKEVTLLAKPTEVFEVK